MREKAPNIPTLRDTPGLPLHRDSGPLASSFPGLLRDSRPGQNAYIMRTKCAQKRKCDIFNYSASTTYNFNTLKCTDFPVPDLNLNPTLNHNLDPPRAQAATLVNSCQLVSIRGCHSKLTKTDRFRPKSPGGYYTNKPIYSLPKRVTQVSNLLYGGLPVCKLFVLRSFAAISSFSSSPSRHRAEVKMRQNETKYDSH